MRIAATDKFDLLFRAFSDRTRIRLLNLLSHGTEICVCDLMRMLDLPQAKVSRHLAYLRKAGLVVARKDQQWMHYKLQPARGKFHAKLLECLECCASEVPTLKRDVAKLGRSCQPQVDGNTCCE